MSAISNMPLSPLSYHAAFTLIELLKCAGAPIRMRINLVDEIYGDICAKLDNKQDRGMKEEEKEEMRARLAKIEEALDILRDNYELAIDVNPYTYGKAAAFEKTISRILREEKTIMEKYGVLSKDQFLEMGMVSPSLTKRYG